MPYRSATYRPTPIEISRRRRRLMKHVVRGMKNAFWRRVIGNAKVILLAGSALFSVMFSIHTIGTATKIMKLKFVEANNPYSFMGTLHTTASDDIVFQTNPTITGTMLSVLDGNNLEEVCSLDAKDQLHFREGGADACIRALIKAVLRSGR